MTTLHCSPDGAFDNGVLLRLTRGRVFTADLRGVAKFHVVAAGGFSTVVRTEAMRPPHVVYVGDELPHVRDGVCLFIPYGRIHLEALSANTIRYSSFFLLLFPPKTNSPFLAPCGQKSMSTGTNTSSAVQTGAPTTLRRSCSMTAASNGPG